MKYFFYTGAIALLISITSCSDPEPIDKETLKEEIKTELRQELFDDLLSILLGYIPEDVDPEIVGAWELNSGELTNCGEDDGPFELVYSLTMSFNLDGSFSFVQTSVEDSFEDEGLYMASEAQLILFGNETDPDLINYEIVNNVMTLSIGGDTECIQLLGFDRVVES